MGFAERSVSHLSSASSLLSKVSSPTLYTTAPTGRWSNKTESWRFADSVLGCTFLQEQQTSSTPKTTRPYALTSRYPNTGHIRWETGNEVTTTRQLQKIKLWNAPADIIRVRGRGCRTSVSPAGNATKAEGRMKVNPTPTELSETDSLKHEVVSRQWGREYAIHAYRAAAIACPSSCMICVVRRAARRMGR